MPSQPVGYPPPAVPDKGQQGWFRHVHTPNGEVKLRLTQRGRLARTVGILLAASLVVVPRIAGGQEDPALAQALPAATAAAAANPADIAPLPLIDQEEITSTPAVIPPSERVFVSDEADEIAQKLGLTAGDYFTTDISTLEAVSEGGLLTSPDAPYTEAAFPESVNQYKDEMINAAQKYDVSPNELAAIMFVESGGDVNAESPVGATGLMQVMDEMHFALFQEEAAGIWPEAASVEDYRTAKTGGDSQVPLEVYKQAILDPQININVGARIFRDCLNAAKQTFPDAPGTVAVSWAAMAYNAGPGIIGADWHKLHSEPARYMNFSLQMSITIKMVGELMAQGHSSEEISQLMKLTPEMQARMAAMRKLMQNRGDFDWKAHGTDAAYQSANEAAGKGVESDNSADPVYVSLYKDWLLTVTRGGASYKTVADGLYRGPGH